MRRSLRLERLEDRRLLTADQLGVVRGGQDWLLNTDGDQDHEIDLRYGLPGDKFFPGDWSGADLRGPDYPGVVRRHPVTGYWWWLLDSDGDPDDEYRFQYGFADAGPGGPQADIPVVGDFNGDGISDVGVARAVDGFYQWIVRYGPFPARQGDDSGPVLNGEVLHTWGAAGDTPVVGDWNGDGTDDPGVVSQVPLSGTYQWWLAGQTNPTQFGTFGSGIPVTGDWDANGRDDLGVFTVASAGGLAQWTLDLNRDPAAERVVTYGRDGDRPVVGDWQFPELTVLQDGQPFYDGQTLNLGIVPYGGTVDKAFLVRNDGTSVLTITNCSLAGQGLGITDGLVASLGPGASDTFGLRFQASTLGPLSGSITIWSNDANESPYDIFIVGTVVDRTAPTATLAAGNVTAWQAAHEFTVTYRDNAGVDADSLGADDVQVSGPAGSSVPVEFLRVDSPSDGSPRTATYRIVAPWGRWSALDNGTYTVSLRPNAVVDIAGNAAAAGTLGTFQINVPETAAAAQLGSVRAGTDWYLNQDADQEHEIDLRYGIPGDKFFTGDWSGANQRGPDYPGVVRRNPVTGYWWWLLDGDGDPDDEYRFQYGFADAAPGQGRPLADIPVVGDFNGDGITDVGVARAYDKPRSGGGFDRVYQWIVLSGPFPTRAADQPGPVLNGSVVHEWGLAGDTPVVGDWNGDGRDEPGVVSRVPYDGTNLCQWWLVGATQNPSLFGIFGGDRPVVIDWDRNGTDNVGVFRPAGQDQLSQWLLDRDGDPDPERVVNYGLGQDVPVVGWWQFPELSVQGAVNNQTAAVEFGTTAKGVASTRTFSVRNDGSATLVLGSIQTTGPFLVQEPLAASLAPGQSDSFTIALQSDQVGDFAGQVSFATNDGNELSFRFPLHGSVNGPDVQVQRARDLLRVYPGQTVDVGTFNQDLYAPVSFFVYNRGNAAVQISDFVLPIGYSLLSVKDGVGPLPMPLNVTLGPDGWVEIVLQLDTSQITSRQGTVRFRTSDPTLSTFSFEVLGHVVFNPRVSEVGVFRDGRDWYLDTNHDPTHELAFRYGLPGDKPLVGDWDGQGGDNLGVARAGADGRWHFLLDLDLDPEHEQEVVFGTVGGIPVVGDWDGNGTDNVGVVYPVLKDGLRQLEWQRDTDGRPDVDLPAVIWGLEGDTPVVGDWDGDGRDEPGVVSRVPYDGTNLCQWWLFGASQNPSLFGIFGSDRPVVGDWDGDVKDDLGVVRRVPGGVSQWLLDTNRDPHVDLMFAYGLENDVPVVGRWLPGNRRATVQGYVWDDRDADGTRDGGESGIAGQRVYLDLTNNGRFDEQGDMWTFTQTDDLSTPDDESGRYVFLDLPPGTYFVNTVAPVGSEPTYPLRGGSYVAGQIARYAYRGWDPSQIGQASVPLNTGHDTSTQFLPPPVPAGSRGQDNLLQVRLDAFLRDPRFGRYDGRGFSVVVIDTGINQAHPAFGGDTNRDGVADRILCSLDFSEAGTASDASCLPQSSNSAGADQEGHGSHVASIAAGNAVNGAGAAVHGLGVATGAGIISLKVFPDGGGGTNAAALERALQWVVRNAPRYNIAAVNLSLATGNDASSRTSHALHDEFAALSSLGVLTVAAAGNGYSSCDVIGPCPPLGVAFPASDPAVIAVGAVDGFDRLSSFGQRHPLLLDIVAPGEQILGAGMDSGTQRLTGTSQAAPHVAGAAVLAQQIAVDYLGRRLTEDEFRGALAAGQATVADLPNGAVYKRLDLLAMAEHLVKLPAVDGDRRSYKTRVAASDNATGVSFGQFRPASTPPPTGVISGTVFEDRDFDGRRDAGEPGQPGRTVYLDLDRNGRLDSDDRQTVTSADGTYEFTGLPSDTFDVRLSPVANWATASSGVFALVPKQHFQSAAENRTFPPPGDLTALQLEDGVQPAASVVVDLNRDGRMDLVTASSRTPWTSGDNPQGVTVWLGTSPTDARWQLPAKYPLAAVPTDLVVRDFNKDNRLDLAVAQTNGQVALFLQRAPSGGQVVLARQTPEISAGTRSVSLAAGDFDRDGYEDLAVADASQNTVAIELNRERGGTWVRLPIPVGTRPVDVVADDIDGDGDSDLWVVNAGSRDLSLIMNNWSPALAATRSPAEGDFPEQRVPWDGGQAGSTQPLVELAAADFDGNGRRDIAVLDLASRRVGAFEATVAAGQVSLRRLWQSPEIRGVPTSLAQGDFNGDQTVDLAVVVDNASRVDVMLGGGDGTFSEPISFDTATYLGGTILTTLTAGDVNGDGRCDVVLSIPDDQRLTILQSFQVQELQRAELTDTANRVDQLDFAAVRFVPEDFQVKALSTTTVELTWQPTRFAQRYVVYQGDTAETKLPVAELGAGTGRYVISTAAPGTRYGFCVEAVAGGAERAMTDWHEVWTPPTAPTDLVVQATSSASLRLSWGDVAGETGYEVYRQVSSTQRQLVQTVAANVTQVDVPAAAGLRPGERVTLLIRAANASGGSFSAPISVLLPPAAPTITRAVAKSTTQVQLAWSKSAGAAFYDIFRRDAGPAEPSLVATVSSRTTVYTLKNLLPGTRVSFWIRARNDAGADVSQLPAWTPVLLPPAAPTNLVAQWLSSTALRLSWTPSAGVASYVIYHWVSGKKKERLDLSGATSSLLREGLLLGKTQCFTIEAVNESGRSRTPTFKTVYRPVP